MTTLKAVTTKIGSGATPRGGASVYVDEGAAFIRSQNVLDLCFSSEGLARIGEDAAEGLRNVAVEPGDVLVNITGDSVARVALWPRNEPARVSQHVAIVRCDPAQVDARYMQYWLHAPAQKAQLLTLSAAGASRPALTKGMLEAFPFGPHPLAEQKAIAEVLGALDDKIAANRRVIDMADTLRATLWQRLCRHSEPRPLSSLARFVNGRAFTKDATGTGRVVVRIAELNSGLSGSTVRNDIDVADDHLARPGDFLMAWSGSLTAARWFRDEAIVNQHIFKVIPTEGRSLWSVACAVDSKMADFKHEAAGKATTMGHIQRRHLDEPVLWPVLNDENEAQGQAIWERALAAERENETLAKSRDELLSPLMSGKITVRDAEKRVEGVV
jgi:type I restriction enzyme S subunit